MTAEGRSFRADPLCKAVCACGQWDELAKEMEVPVIDLEVLKRKAVGLLSREAQ